MIELSVSAVAVSAGSGVTLYAFGEQAIIHPGAFDKYFAHCAQEFAKRGEPDMQKIIAISAEFGIHFAEESQA
jgi:hypothetical protein